MVWRRLVALLALVIILPSTSIAETTLSDLTELSRAVVDSVRVAADLIDYASEHPDPAGELESHLTEIEQITHRWEVDYRAALRLSRNEFARPELVTHYAAEIDRSMQYVKNTAFNVFEDKIDTIDPSRVDTLLEPIDILLEVQTAEALQRNLESLRRLERKYGPGSAQLNWVELGVNHFLLRGWDWVGLDENDRPGPLEFILAYAPSWISFETDAVRSGLPVVTTVEFGTRWYLFANGWGEGNLLKPAYLSFGGLVAGEGDGFLADFTGNLRLGGFIGWGALKAAVLFRDEEASFLLSRQFQLVPTLF